MTTHEFTPTDEQIERMNRAFFLRTKEGRDGFSYPLSTGWALKRDLDDARRALVEVVTGVKPPADLPPFTMPQYRQENVK